MDNWSQGYTGSRNESGGGWPQLPNRRRITGGQNHFNI
jgi:hypothetical protein